MTGMKMRMTPNNRLVITGMGAVTPIGIGVEDYWNNLTAGKCGVEKITRFDTTDLPVKIAAEVKGFKAEKYMPKKLTREMDIFMQYGYAAAMEAIEQAGEPAGWALSWVRHWVGFPPLQRRRMASAGANTKK